MNSKEDGVLKKGVTHMYKECYEFDSQPKSGSKKGRLELCRIYATDTDVPSSSTEKSDLITCKYVCSKAPLSRYASQRNYRERSQYSSTDLNDAFTQWHGMPNSLLFRTPDSTRPLHATSGSRSVKNLQFQMGSTPLARISLASHTP